MKWPDGSFRCPNCYPRWHTALWRRTWFYKRYAAWRWERTFNGYIKQAAHNLADHIDDLLIKKLLEDNPE